MGVLHRARTYHGDETRDRLRARAYGDGGLVVVVGMMPHQGAWESHAQGEAVQVDDLARGSARDVRLLNWRKAATGEPCDAETVTHGSKRDGGKRAARNLARRLLYPQVTEFPYYSNAQGNA